MGSARASSVVGPRADDPFARVGARAEPGTDLLSTEILAPWDPFGRMDDHDMNPATLLSVAQALVAGIQMQEGILLKVLNGEV
jgi:hypothetical protein